MLLSSSNITRWGILGAGLAGVAWIAAAVLELASAETQGSILVTYPLVAYLCAWVGTLAGLLGLHSVQSPRQRWSNLTGFIAAFVGAGLALAGTVLALVGVGEVLVRRELLDQALGLGFFISFLGVTLFGVGFVFWGVAIVLTRSMPRWRGALMIVAMLIAWILIALGWVGANVVLGLLWLALGYALWFSR